MILFLKRKQRMCNIDVLSAIFKGHNRVWANPQAADPFWVRLNPWPSFIPIQDKKVENHTERLSLWNQH